MNVDIKVTKYNKEDVYFVESGYRKHYLHFSNCDAQAGIMYFIIMNFNKGNISWPVDRKLWTDFINFINKQFRKEKDFSFPSTLNADNTAYTRKNFSDVALFYSGGKDSTFAHQIMPGAVLVQFHSPVYKFQHCANAESFTSNVDNELFHAKVPSDILKLEIMLPLISKYGRTRMGIEKDSWDYHTQANGFDIAEWQKLLAKHNLDFDSPIRNFYSDQILKELKLANVDFVKCNYGTFSKRADKVDDGKDFCYDCSRCIINFLMGCNKEEHSFDVKKFIELKVKPTGAKTYRHFIELRYQNGFASDNQREVYLHIGEIFNSLDKIIPYE